MGEPEVVYIPSEDGIIESDYLRVVEGESYEFWIWFTLFQEGCPSKLFSYVSSWYFRAEVSTLAGYNVPDRSEFRVSSSEDFDT